MGGRIEESMTSILEVNLKNKKGDQNIFLLDEVATLVWKWQVIFWILLQDEYVKCKKYKNIVVHFVLYFYF
jgi:hypothetical protein